MDPLAPQVAAVEAAADPDRPLVLLLGDERMAVAYGRLVSESTPRRCRELALEPCPRTGVVTLPGAALSDLIAAVPRLDPHLVLVQADLLLTAGPELSTPQVSRLEELPRHRVLTIPRSPAWLSENPRWRRTRGDVLRALDGRLLLVGEQESWQDEDFAPDGTLQPSGVDKLMSARAYDVVHTLGAR